MSAQPKNPCTGCWEKPWCRGQCADWMRYTAWARQDLFARVAAKAAAHARREKEGDKPDGKESDKKASDEGSGAELSDLQL